MPALYLGVVGKHVSLVCGVGSWLTKESREKGAAPASSSKQAATHASMLLLRVLIHTTHHNAHTHTYAPQT